MNNRSFIRCVLSMMVCYSMLSVHARAEQSADTLNNTFSGSAVNQEVVQTADAGNSVYPETAHDGEKGKNIAEQLKIEPEQASETDWLADVAKRIQLHGYAQGWYYFQHTDNENTNSFLCKRTLLWANAQITKRWSFLFMHDFNSVVQEYYTDLQVTNNKALTIRFGQFKNAVSYENPLSPTAMETIDVYSEGVTYLTGCGSDPMNGVQYGRDQGVAVFGETNNKKFRYEVQVMNGSGINIKDKNKQKDLIGRFELRPAKGLNLCVTGQYGKGNSLVANPVFNPQMQLGENYKRNRATIGADYKSQPFNVHSEYLYGEDGDVCSHGAYITGSVRLCTFRNNTSLDAVASYDYFDFAKNHNKEMQKAVIGLQYWFFKKCRFQLQYVYKDADTNYRTFFNRGDVHQIITQMQVRFN